MPDRKIAGQVPGDVQRRALGRRHFQSRYVDDLVVLNPLIPNDDPRRRSPVFATDISTGASVIDPPGAVKSRRRTASDDPAAARPKPGRGRLAPHGTEAPCSPRRHREDGAVVPSQPGACDRTAGDRLATPENAIHTRDVHASRRQFSGWSSILRLGLWITRSDHSHFSGENHRQLGSQICMFHVDCEIGMPVRIGYIHAKFVITRAT